MSDVQKTLDEKQYDWKEVQQFRAIFLFVLLFAVEEGGGQTGEERGERDMRPPAKWISFMVPNAFI